MNMKRCPMVEVEWIDSVASGGWRKIEDYETREPTNCVSVGYLVSKTRERIVLLQNLNPENGDASDSMTIPRACVKKIYYLTRSE